MSQVFVWGVCVGWVCVCGGFVVRFEFMVFVCVLLCVWCLCVLWCVCGVCVCMWFCCVGGVGVCFCRV